MKHCSILLDFHTMYSQSVKCISTLLKPDIANSYNEIKAQNESLKDCIAVWYCWRQLVDDSLVPTAFKLPLCTWIDIQEDRFKATGKRTHLDRNMGLMICTTCKYRVSRYKNWHMEHKQDVQTL